MTKLGNLSIAFKYAGNERQKTFITVKNAGGDVLVETHVKRAVDDGHDKLLGRFYAFKKAMNQLMLRNLATREQRKEAWLLFKEMVKTPAHINLVTSKREPVLIPVKA